MLAGKESSVKKYLFGCKHKKKIKKKISAILIFLVPPKTWRKVRVENEDGKKKNENLHPFSGVAESKSKQDETFLACFTHAAENLFFFL